MRRKRRRMGHQGSFSSEEKMSRDFLPSRKERRRHSRTTPPPLTDRSIWHPSHIPHFFSPSPSKTYCGDTHQHRVTTSIRRKRLFSFRKSAFQKMSISYRRRGVRRKGWIGTYFGWRFEECDAAKRLFRWSQSHEIYDLIE